MPRAAELNRRTARRRGVQARQRDGGAVPGAGISWRGLCCTLLATIVFALVVLFLVALGHQIWAAPAPLDAAIRLAKEIYWYNLRHFVNSPVMLIGLPAVFVLQLVAPAERGQRLFGPGTRADILWTLASFAFVATALPAYLAFLRTLYEDWIGAAAPALSLDLPPWAAAVLGFLLIDFLAWFHHLVRHKVPAFWVFHAVHHSQRAMNPFARDRIHPVDQLVASAIIFLPMFLFEDGLGIALNYFMLQVLLDHANHANIRTNFGVLRYVLVTPQSHRVHHSNRREHYDRNYGVALSIWDHLFGTQYRDYDIYPETGIPDPDFPYEDAPGLAGLLRRLVAQFLYPFKVLIPHVRADLRGGS